MATKQCWLRELKNEVDAVTDDQIPAEPNLDDDSAPDPDSLQPAGQMSLAHRKLYLVKTRLADAHRQLYARLDARQTAGQEIGRDDRNAYISLSTKIQLMNRLMWSTLARDFGIPFNGTSMNIVSQWEVRLGTGQPDEPPTKLRPPRQPMPDLLTEIVQAMDALEPEDLYEPEDEMEEGMVEVGVMDDDHRRIYTLFRQLKWNEQDYGRRVPIDMLQDMMKAALFASLDDCFDLTDKPVTAIGPGWKVAYGDQAPPPNPLAALFGGGLGALLGGGCGDECDGQCASDGGNQEDDEDDEFAKWWDEQDKDLLDDEGQPSDDEEGQEDLDDSQPEGDKEPEDGDGDKPNDD